MAHQLCLIAPAERLLRVGKIQENKSGHYSQAVQQFYLLIRTILSRSHGTARRLRIVAKLQNSGAIINYSQFCAIQNEVLYRC